MIFALEADRAQVIDAESRVITLMDGHDCRARRRHRPDLGDFTLAG
jgi:hypothetical protein